MNTIVAIAILSVLVSVLAFWAAILHRRSNTLRILFHAHRNWSHDVTDGQGQRLANLLDGFHSLERRTGAWIRRMQDCASQHAVAHVERTVEQVDDRLGKLEQATGGLWRTAQGYVLQIRDMTDEHLDNARAYLKDRGLPPNPNIEAECRRRVEAAKIQGQVRLEKKQTTRVIAKLRKERLRRPR